MQMQATSERRAATSSSASSTAAGLRRSPPEETFMTFADLIPTLPPSDNDNRLSSRVQMIVAGTAAVIAALVLLISLATALALRKRPNGPEDTFGMEIPTELRPRSKAAYSCSTDYCSKEAELIAQSVNKSKTSACDDFYDFVCHGWLQENPITAQASKTSYQLNLKERIEAGLLAFVEAESPRPNTMVPSYNVSVVSKYVAFVRGCQQKASIEAVGVKPLRRVLADLGLREWPSTRVHEPNVEEVAARVMRDLGEATLFSVTVDWDIANKSKNILTIDQPPLPMMRGHLLGNAKNLEAYRNLVKTAMALIKPREPLEGLAGDVMNLVHRMARSTKTEKERMKIGVHFLRERLDSLQGKSKWNWRLFLNTILAGIHVLEPRDFVRVKTPFYMVHMSRILSTVSSANLFNFVGFQVVLTLSPLLFEPAQGISQLRLRRRFESKGEESTSQKICLHLAEDAMPLATLHTYATIFHKLYQPSVERVMYTVENIRYFMKVFVDQTYWMEDAAKMVAKYKLQNMKVNVFYPPWVFDTEKLGRIYAQAIVNTKEIAESYYLARRASMRHYWLRFDMHGTETYWVGSTFDTDCTYDCLTNSLYIPMGLYSEPVLHSDISAVMSVSRPGARIAHAMLAAIDRRGSQFTVSQMYQKWWTEETLFRYAQTQSCFIEQYKSIVDRKLHVRLTSTGSTDVNIADNAVPEVLLEAFLQTIQDLDLDENSYVIAGLGKFNIKQIFYMSYAMGFCEDQREDLLKKELLHGVSSPPKYRINIPFGNLPAFSEAFSCHTGAPMNRSSRCSLWQSYPAEGIHRSE
ncbi:neprilysin-1-like [Ornithodoros turicata]|uniref:neprilysin-1-like n=1 Tax=Ornithodoros turicata TaxID=34597 RepID=UPI003139BF39